MKIFIICKFIICTLFMDLKFVNSIKIFKCICKGTKCKMLARKFKMAQNLAVNPTTKVKGHIDILMQHL